MTWKSFLAICAVTLLAAALALPALAQNSRDQGPVAAHATELHVVQMDESPVPLTTIYSSLGTYVAGDCPDVNHFYTGCSWLPDGWLICGVTSASCGGTQENIAVPFTPKVSATMHHIEIPVESYAGTSTFTASLQADCAGAPCGVYIVSKHTTAAAAFYTCCGARAGGGVIVGLTHTLTAGTRYWVVADTNNAADTATGNVWAFSGVNPYYSNCVSSASPCTTYSKFFADEAPALKVY
jgi:hypothetical protein